MNNLHFWANESSLRIYGYTTNSKDDLSDRERQDILAFIIENGIEKRQRVAEYL